MKNSKYIIITVFLIYLFYWSVGVDLFAFGVDFWYTTAVSVLGGGFMYLCTRPIK